MIRWSAFLWSVVGIVMAIVVFQIKYKVQELEGELASANARILQDQEAIQVLRAEWSYLNRPARISELAQRYLEVGSEGQPVTFAVAEIEALPLRLEGVVRRGPDAGPLLPQPKPILVATPSQSSPADGVPALPANPQIQPPGPTLHATFASFGGAQ